MEKIFQGLIILEGMQNELPIKILDDSGCMGMVLGKKFVELHNLKTKISTDPIQVSFANPSMYCTSNETCTLWIKVVLPVAYDVIFGLPFHSTILITNGDWKNHTMSFRTQSGTHHKWFGKHHYFGSAKHKVIMLTSVNSIDATDIVSEVILQETSAKPMTNFNINALSLDDLN
ncbi:hypothetical protein HK096_008124, partial [Nowakowskiella sp. JEL0078]